MIARLSLALGLLVLSVAGIAPAFAQAEPPAAQQQAPGEWRHALALFGDIKYPAGFRHFDYVNADAPKGGRARLSAIGTFDSFNPFITRGNPAAGTTMSYDTLMAPSYDEPSTEYGLLAEAVRHPADYSSVTYRLRPEARWWDGRPVTPDDVVWSFGKLKEISPQQAYYYANVVAAEVTGEREVTFRFDRPGNRELPQIVGQLNVLPRHWWEGKDAQGRQRDVSAGSLEPPMGSGPYRVKEFAAGRWVSFERVPDYWGKDLPVNVGQNNFDEMRFDYFRDSTVLVEAFKADQYDFRNENSAKNWATAYDFPAVKEGRVILEKFEDKNSGVMQGYGFNLRREKFKDPRVRRAIGLALDFEELNKTIFFNQYERPTSYFHGTDLASSGVPEGRELAILKEVDARTKLPASVFTEPYKLPTGGSQEASRNNLRTAAGLLREAGYDQKGGRLVHRQTGEPLTIEFLYVDPSSERPLGQFGGALQRLGIQVQQRPVDDTQYINRIRNRDFDMVTIGRGQSLSPGNEQREFWGSEAADRAGSGNWLGIKDPAIDALIEKVIFATDRAELVAATKALDRVLLWNEFVVPQWTVSADRTARWNRFSHPEKMPARGPMFPTIWWWDAAKAAKTGGRS
jgi:microcin C transport system substrate-binding protein